MPVAIGAIKRWDWRRILFTLIAGVVVRVVPLVIPGVVTEVVVVPGVGLVELGGE